MSVPRFNVLGVGVNALNLELATQSILDAAQRPHAGYVCVADARSIIETRDDPALQRIFNDAFLVTPDGMPLVWLGPAGTARVYGPDLMLTVCDAGRSLGLRHFLYGGAPGVVEDLRENLVQRFPGLEICGTFTPPYRALEPSEFAALQRDVALAHPHIIWVGLSTPKQEHFMATQGPDLDAGLLIGVGAAFDFHTGRVAQAPRWMQRSGLEWFHRILQEPRRLGSRYLRTLPRFVWLVILQKLDLLRGS